MSTEVPWNIPPKRGGEPTENITFRMPVSFIEALKAFAAEENETFDPRIGYPTIIMDLTTRDSNFFRNRRSKLRKLREQLNKEKHRATSKSKGPTT